MSTRVAKLVRYSIFSFVALLPSVTFSEGIKYEASAEALGHTIEFLTTTSFAIFAALAYLIKNRISSKEMRSLSFILSILAFMANSASLFFGYRARLDLVAELSGGSGRDEFSYEHVGGYSIQAMLVLLSGVLLLLTLVFRAREK